MAAKVRIGILGGTFDPIHIGHLIIAEEVRQSLELREVVFVPAGQPCLRWQEVAGSPGQRLEMVKLAISSNPYFRASSIEVDRKGESYTIDTIRELLGQYGAAAELYFILGFDSLAGLPGWKEPQRLMDLCQLVGVGRPGYGEFALENLDLLLPGASKRILIVDVPQIGVSATDIRRRVSCGLSIRYLVPDRVEDHIVEQGLYREEKKSKIKEKR